MKSFPERLLHIQGDETQKDFAKSLGIPLNTYTSWLRGERLPSYDGIVLICAKKGYSADWLLGLADNDKIVDLTKKPSSLGVKKKVQELKEYANNASKKADELLSAIEKIEVVL